MKYKYRLKGNATGENVFIPGVGAFTDGVIESPIALESPVLELITEGETQVQPAPQHLDGVAPQDVQPIAPEQTPQPESEGQL